MSHIAKTLGVTDAGLDCLARAVANDGVAEGRGFFRGQGARGRLERDGLISLVDGDAPIMARMQHFEITDKGRAIVAEARRLGY